MKKEANTSIAKQAVEDGDLHEEYDFASMKGGVRGKYFNEYQKGSNVVLLALEVAAAFCTSDTVNEALHNM
jgi:hypothetical protein